MYAHSFIVIVYKFCTEWVGALQGTITKVQKWNWGLKGTVGKCWGINKYVE